MKSRVTSGALALVLLWAACAPEAEPPAQANTTANLLAQPVSDGLSTPIAPTAPNASGAAAPERLPVTDLGFNRGSPEAIVKVIELSDFGCGYCRQFHDETFPTLRQQYIDSGMVEWKFMPYITGMFDNSLAATEAGECVMEQSDEAYETMALRMWNAQREWKDTSEPGPLLRGWASELSGVDMGEFDSCLAEDRRVERIASATALARELGVRGTPTFVVVGYPPLQGALPLEFFQRILSAVHDEETRKRAPTGPRN